MLLNREVGVEMNLEQAEGKSVGTHLGERLEQGLRQHQDTKELSLAGTKDVRHEEKGKSLGT